MLQTWVAKSASWYITDPLKNTKFVYEWVDLKKNQNLSQIDSKSGVFFLKILENGANFAKIWSKIVISMHGGVLDFGLDGSVPLGPQDPNPCLE